MKYRGSLLLNTVLSAAAALAAEVALLLNSRLADVILCQFGFQGSVASLSGEYNAPLIFVYLLIGIGVFAFVFGMLQHRTLKYTRKISASLQEISEGHFNTRIPVRGDNELSDIAMQVNHMAEEIEQLMEKEKQAEETKNELITNIAHDLRTPLTSILGYLDILSTRKDLPEETRQNYIRIAHDKAKHLQQMIEDLFGFTKLSYSRQTANMQPIDIITLLAQLLDEFYPVFENNEMEYEYHPDAQNFVIQGDATLLVRLFDNLINNAIKYGKEGKRLIVNTKTKNDTITVDIINFGKVIPQKDLDRIFEKFYRAEASRNSATGGTGLGLAIAANVARVHGGSIEAKSSLEGTVFSVTLPSKHEEAQADEAAEPKTGTKTDTKIDTKTNGKTETKGVSNGADTKAGGIG